MALPLISGRTQVVSFVLNRARRDFSDNERELLDLLRPCLANLYRRTLAAEAVRAELAKLRAATREAPMEFGVAALILTPREREVLYWVGLGKTNAQIAAILGLSVRTVQKHLEHVFVKLRVPSRTAAISRLLAGAKA